MRTHCLQIKLRIMKKVLRRVGWWEEGTVQGAAQWSCCKSSLPHVNIRVPLSQCSSRPTVLFLLPPPACPPYIPFLHARPHQPHQSVSHLHPATTHRPRCCLPPTPPFPRSHTHMLHFLCLTPESGRGTYTKVSIFMCCDGNQIGQKDTNTP